MKNKLSSKLIHSTVVILMFNLFSIVNAQNPICNYTVTNGMSCPIDVQVEWYDSGAGCSGICDTQIATIGASGSVGFNCSGCGTPCNVRVIVTTANNVANGSSADITDFNTIPLLSNQPSAGGGCLPLGFYAYWHWNYNTCTIVVGP